MDKMSQYIHNTNVEVVYKLMQTFKFDSRNCLCIPQLQINIFASNIGFIKQMTTHPKNPLMLNTKTNICMNIT